MEHQVTIEGGEAFSVAANEDTLLRGALRAGVGFPHECSVGGCGACRFELVSGTMETLWLEAPGLAERDRRRGKRLACQSRPTSNCTIRVRCADSYRPIVDPNRWSAVLLNRRALTPDMSEFTLHVPDAAQFRPGQYALLYPPMAQGARAYSMSNLSNGDGLWQFIIRRVPGGASSNALFDIRVGERITLDGPYGHAFLRDENERDIICIAGGSGFAPMLSVARGALAQPGSRRVSFFYGARTQADLGASAELDEIAHERLDTTIVLSTPQVSSPWRGATGFVHEEVERAIARPLNRYEFYFAGPAPMVDAIQTLLMQKHQVPFAQVHFDRFL
ncbi:toluene-4-monooxygenase electron transfer protein TmoF (plasmid) [Cupriavidus necator N-1]|uniref:Toluene-4-monooxygenase electron transfer protein TmoF n=1 Tax=Cupriavidus necator (strain ATCC 43291 / DSM 13513 / CCUG 52238 / LMG 8453 / N-1) TaxID=1042878 RepID=F8GVL2_CUPNN|nr:2Fe-2S iron-sulfur cluster-binding protein [Cupriavidus necator]AEI82632.1 toluene-4-monooxygenase electron transfer protein TmoF [Cupriavidus necator N-1]MDX6007629.1 2Fe-2S iron-sulfur cluster-binding protein [Cupriavidus necator]